MSDRFVLYATKKTVEDEFDVSGSRDDFFEPRYNVTPGTLVPVIYRDDGVNRINAFQWGMIPDDAGDEKEGIDNTDTPAEEIRDDERLAKTFRDRRCIVPANGFYKWKASKKKSTPFYIRLLSNDLIGLAGIYSVWRSDRGREVYSFSIISTESNALVQPVAERMPVILRPTMYDIWLGGKTADSALYSSLLKPYLLTEMAVNRVADTLNDPQSEGPELIQPIP